MMIQPIFKDINGETRCTGYATVTYSGSDDAETVVETTETELADIFQTAADAGIDELPNIGEPIEAAIDDPLRFRDYLIHRDGEIEFDEDYER